MSWIDDLNNAADVGQVYKFQPPKRKPQPKAAKKKKNFLVDNISTLGGILGGIGGSFASPIVGTGLGAGAGSALGEALENAIMGESLGANVGKEAAIGGVLGAGPLRLAGKAVSKTLPRAGKGIETAGKNLLGTQANLTRAEARKLGTTPQDTLGEVNRRTGLTSIGKMADVAGNVTGQNGILAELTKNAIGNTKGVDIGDIGRLSRDLLTDLAPSITGSVRKNVEKQVTNNIAKSYGGSKGSLSSLADPYQAFDAARTFESNAARLRSLPTPTSADKELADVYSSLAKEVNGRLFKAPGVNEGIAQARPDAVQAFKKLAGTAPSRAEKRAYERLATEAETLGDVQSVRSAQAPFVQLGKIDEATARAQAGAGAQLGDNAQGLGRFVQRPTNILALPLNAATPRVGGALTRAGRSLQGQGAPQTAKGIAGRVGVGGLASTLVNQAQPAPNEPQPPQPIDQQMPPSQLVDTTQQSEDDSPLSPVNVQAGIKQILASGGDLDDAAKYVSLITALQELGGPAEEEKPGYGRPTAQQYAQGTAGLDSVARLEDILGSDPSLVGRDATPGQSLPGIGGLVSRAAGTNEYRALTNNILNSISRINTGAAMPQSEEGFYRRAYLPQPGDNEATQRRKLANIRQFFAPIVSYKGGGDDISSILASQGAVR